MKKSEMTYRGGEHTHRAAVFSSFHITPETSDETRSQGGECHMVTWCPFLALAPSPSIPLPTLTPALSRQADLEDGGDAERARD